MALARTLSEENDDLEDSLLSSWDWSRAAGCAFCSGFSMSLEWDTVVRARTVSPLCWTKSIDSEYIEWCWDSLYRASTKNIVRVALLSYAASSISVSMGIWDTVQRSKIADLILDDWG